MYIAVDSKRKSAILQIFSPKDNLRTTIRHHHFIILLYTSILVPSSWKRITVQDSYFVLNILTYLELGHIQGFFIPYCAPILVEGDSTEINAVMLQQNKPRRQ